MLSDTITIDCDKRVQRPWVRVNVAKSIEGIAPFYQTLPLKGWIPSETGFSCHTFLELEYKGNIITKQEQEMVDWYLVKPNQDPTDTSITFVPQEQSILVYLGIVKPPPTPKLESPTPSDFRQDL